VCVIDDDEYTLRIVIYIYNKKKYDMYNMDFVLCVYDVYVCGGLVVII